MRTFAAFLLIGVPAFYHFNAPDGTFTVNFPDQAPVEWKRPTSVIWTTLNRPNQYMVQEFFDPKLEASKAKEVLRNYPNPEAGGIKGTAVDLGEVQSGPYIGRAVRIEGTAMAGTRAKRRRIRVVEVKRAFVTDGHLYVISVDASEGRPIDAELADQFFTSFELKK